MLKYDYKKYFLFIEDIYFADKLQKSDAHIVRYFQYSNSSDQIEDFKLFKTNIIRLNVSIDNISSHFRKSIKSEINQSQKNDKTIVMFFNKPDDYTIDLFIDAYNEFAKLKNLPLPNRNKIKGMSNNILISNANINEKIVVWHLYIYDNDRIRLLYSSTIETKDKELYTRIAKANKFLHFEDIKYAKNNNFDIYDFGGLNLQDNSVVGIDQFKLGFSKEIEESRHFIITNTFLGKIVVKIYTLLRYQK